MMMIIMMMWGTRNTFYFRVVIIIADLVHLFLQNPLTHSYSKCVYDNDDDGCKLSVKLRIWDDGIRNKRKENEAMNFDGRKNNKNS